MIVVGSSHTGRLGRVLPGSTAERLLRGAPCPVVVVPAGRGTTAERGFETVACAWDGTPESDAALGAAEALARSTGATLRVIRVFEPQLYAFPPGLGYGYASLAERVGERAERRVRPRHPLGLLPGHGRPARRRGRRGARLRPRRLAGRRCREGVSPAGR